MPPKAGTAFVAHHDRLALFHETRDGQAFWSDYWLGDHTRKEIERASTGTLDPGFDCFLDMVTRLVPSTGTILEAGCGPGYAVAALHARGYRATGLDNVPEIVAFTRSVNPALDMQVGDVEALPFPDASFDCYASLGVVEHFEQGPARVIAEAYRVVKPGGVAIFEMPFLNALRANHLQRIRAARAPSNLTFYQYYYAADEMTALLAAAGFDVLERVPNCWEGVVYREHPIFARFWSSPLAVGPIKDPIRRLVKALPYAGRLRYAHTMAFACRRPAASR